MTLQWERRFGKEKLADSLGGKTNIELLDTNSTNSLKCKYCGKESLIKPGTENSNTFRCSHCGMTLKVGNTLDIGNQGKYMGGTDHDRR